MKIHDTISAADASVIRGFSRTWIAKMNDEGTLEGGLTPLPRRAREAEVGSQALTGLSREAREQKPRPG